MPAVGEADISALIECGSFDEDEWRRFTAANPDHDWKRFDGSTMLGVRGRILSHESLGVHDRFRCHRVRVAELGRVARFGAAKAPELLGHRFGRREVIGLRLAPERRSEGLGSAMIANARCIVSSSRRRSNSPA